MKNLENLRMSKVPEDPLEPWIGHPNSPLIHLSLRKDRYPPHEEEQSESDLAEDDQDKNAESTDTEVGMRKRHLAGRLLGDDFSHKNGFSMYRGRTLPGFPNITLPITRVLLMISPLKGMIDYFDSQGAEARIFEGDVIQICGSTASFSWSEMSPLINTQSHNDIEVLNIGIALVGPLSKIEHPRVDVVWDKRGGQQRSAIKSGATQIRSLYGHLTWKSLNEDFTNTTLAHVGESGSLGIAVLDLQPGDSATLAGHSTKERTKTTRLICLLEGAGLLVRDDINRNELKLGEEGKAWTFHNEHDMTFVASSDSAVSLLIIESRFDLTESDIEICDDIRSEFINAKVKARTHRVSEGAQDGDEWTYTNGPTERFHGHNRGRFFRKDLNSRIIEPPTVEVDDAAPSV